MSHTFCLSCSVVVPLWRLCETEKTKQGVNRVGGIYAEFPPGCFLVGQMFRVQGGGEELRDDQTIKEVRPCVLTEPEEAAVIADVRQTGLLSTYYFDILGDNVNKGSPQNIERRAHAATW